MPSVYPSILLFTVAYLTAGSATGQEPARIYVYAQRQSAAKSWISISCDGIAAAKLKRGALFAIAVAGGRHSLSLEHGVPITIEVRPGEDKFLRLDWSYKAGSASIPVLDAVRPERARGEMRFLSYIKSAKVQSDRVIKTDPRPLESLKLEPR